MATIHPTATVEAGACLAQDVKVGPYAFIGAQATLHEGVEVMQGAQVCGKTTLCDGVKVHQYAIIGTPPQDLGYQKEDDVEVVVGARTIVREFVTINAGTKKGGGVTRIGSDCFIMIYCHIGHDCQVGERVITVSYTHLTLPTKRIV